MRGGGDTFGELLVIARHLLAWFMALVAFSLFPLVVLGQSPEKNAEYLLGPGDVIHISVFQNPDLTLDARVSENGTISYPLIGAVRVGGNSISSAEQRIAKMLHDGNFVVSPQVTILLTQIRGNQVAVLGQVNKPGRFPLETADTKLTDVLAEAGGIAPGGSDIVVFAGVRDGKVAHREIDLDHMFSVGESQNNLIMRAGDVLYVRRAPMFYIYGEVQHPGNYRVDRNMTLIEALAVGGGLTPKGTQRGIQVHRRGPDGKVQLLDSKLDDPIQAEDVIYVRESIF